MRNQMKLAFSLASEETAHGGQIRNGKRKTQRPFVPRRPMHLVLRSAKARGSYSLLQPKNDQKIDQILKKQSKKHFVKIMSYVNVGNHLHLKIRANSRDSFQAFLISITALIARAISGAKKGNQTGRFWDALAYTRILKTSYEEKILNKYFNANALEVIFGKEIRDIFLGKKLLTPV